MGRRHDYSGCLQTATQEKTTKTSNNKDHGQTKKLKGPDGLPVSVCNGRDKNEAGGGSQTRSQRLAHISSLCVRWPGQLGFVMLIFLSLRAATAPKMGRRVQVMEAMAIM